MCSHFVEGISKCCTDCGHCWMFHGGDGAGGWRQQLQAIEQELAAESARVVRRASGLLLEWADGSMSAARLQQHCSHAQHILWYNVWGCVGTAHNAHNGLVSSLRTCDIPPLITRVDSDEMR